MSSYSAKDITVLEGLDPVRKRPGMYIGGVGSAGLHHLVWEILDNAVDEAMNGLATNIGVTLHNDGSSITVDDDGRGIPVDRHREEKKSALEVIFTVLHAGGKFEARNYKTAGGLHGVGAWVVNALSRDLVASVKRDGAHWEMRFKQGKPVGPPEEARHRRAGPAPRSTSIRTRRSSRTSSSTPALIRDRLEVVSYLHKGVKVTFENESPARRRPVYQHDEGLVEYLRKIVGERGARPVHDTPFALTRGNGLRLDLVLQWTEATDEHLRGYVNGIPTGSGGTHENGLRAGPRQGRPQLHRDAQPLAERRHPDRRGHPRGPDRRADVFIAGAAVPGADQGPAEQPRAALGGGRRRAPGARALAEPQHQRRRVDRGAHHPGRARARGQPRRAGRSVAQERRPPPG